MRTLILVLLSLPAWGQEVFKADLFVTTIYADTITVAFMEVTFVEKETNMCVKTDLVRCYTELKQHHAPEFSYLGEMVSVLGDRYMLKMNIDDRGIVIWVTNLDHQFPHFVITSREPQR